MKYAFTLLKKDDGVNTFNSEVTGDPKYKDIAVTHFHTTNRFAIRENSSSIQATRFDNETGEHVCNYTRQGYSDTSTWSRGQAWVVYGPALSYKYTDLPLCKEVFDKTSRCFLEHQPEDLVAYYVSMAKKIVKALMRLHKEWGMYIVLRNCHGPE